MQRSGFAAALAPGTVISGKYSVERVLGQGGMGVVVAVRHIDLNQSLALKVLLPTTEATEEAVTRFVREGRSAAQLTSPHVAKVHDTGHLDSGEPYLVMELLHGSDLRVHLSEVGSVPLPKAIAWVLQAAHALAEAHKLNIIHRDIKPANLFLAETSAGEQIKVLDFGVAKQLGISEDLTSTMATVGTPRYMAPEQMRSAKLADLRGDIWSLGVVLYELTTGQHPFHGDSITALCFDVMERTPTQPSELNPALPAVFDEVVARCLEKNPDDRFQSVQELALALYAIAPDSARFSGFFNGASFEPMGAVAAVTPMPASSPDPTGPTKVHPQPARPSQPRSSEPRPSQPGPSQPRSSEPRSSQPRFSQPELVASPDPTGPTKVHPQPARASQPGVVAFPDPTGLTRLHPQNEPHPFIAPPPPASTPSREPLPFGLAVQGTLPSWNTSAQARSDADRTGNKTGNSRLLVLAAGVAITTGALLVVGLASRHPAKTADAPNAMSTTSSAPSPVVSPSSAPTEPVVVALDPPAPSSSVQVVPSSAPSAVEAPPKPTGFAHAPTPGCYFFDERGHKHINAWCR